MAKKISIPIEVVDKFSKSMDDLDSRLASIEKSATKQQTAFNLLSADIIYRYGKQAARAIIDFGQDCLKSFGESERAVASLNNALKNQGFMTEAYSKTLQAQADALQKVTGVSDEAVMSTQALLTTFGLAGKDLQKTTKAALDLSRGLGIDLHSATMLLGKAWTGETQTLSRYGLKIDETKKGAAAFEAVLEQVNARFGGAAVAAAETYLGTMDRLATRWDTLKEKVGEYLSVWTKYYAEVGIKVMDALLKEDDAQKNLTASTDKNAIALRNKIEDQKATIAYLQKEGAGTAEAEAKLKSLSEAYEKFAKIRGRSRKAAVEEGPSSRRMGGEDPETASAAESYRRRMEMQIQYENDIKASRDALQMDQSIRDEQLNQMVAAETAWRVNMERQRNQTIYNESLKALNNLSVLQKSKHKEMAMVGKAAAIAETIIRTYASATASFAALAGIPIVGPALGAAAAAAAITAGLANVAIISGVEFAEGGIVKAREGGVHAIIGEGGRDEAVIPLGDPRARGMLGSPISINNNITLNISGAGASVANMAKELADEVGRQTTDAIQLALRLNNLSTAYAGRAA